jgi:hypothetical protein
MRYGTHDRLETMREIWPEGTCPHDQLYGDKQQLRRTTDFIIKSGVTLVNEKKKNGTTDVSGSGDSPLFQGLPEQKSNIAEGNATWFYPYIVYT